jgi:hypothetical protein
MNNSSDKEILLAVYEGQRAESLQHRQSLFNAYSLSLAGLMALAAGVLATPKPTLGLKIIVGMMVLAVCLSMFKLIAMKHRVFLLSHSLKRPIAASYPKKPRNQILRHPASSRRSPGNNAF